jgi:hypothetical protein
VIGAGGRAVTSAAELAAVVDSHAAGPLTLELLDRGGMSRAVELSPLRVPQLVAFDRTLPTNALAVQFAVRAGSAPAPLERSALRLNLAAAYMSLQNWQGASSELERVIGLATSDLPAGPVRAAVTGTAQYLLGVCARALGDAESAERAWSAAAASGGWMLTAGAEPIADLVAPRRAAGSGVTP